MVESDVIHIDCQGMKCPRPIIELAKAKRRSLIGSQIVITADDLAFESDVIAWCETTGNKIINLEKDDNKIKATIEICKT